MTKIVLIITLFAGIICMVRIWLEYQKDKTIKPEAKGTLAKRILFLAIIAAACDSIAIPLIIYIEPEIPPPATQEDARQAVSESNSAKRTNPPIEETKEETENEQKSTVEKQEKPGIPVLRVYQEGNEADKDNRSKDADTHLEKALPIARTPSFYLSRGNNKLIASDYRAAISAYENALEKYKTMQDRQGEGDALCNLGDIYSLLGQYDKAIDYHTRALVISREIGNRQGERKALAGLGFIYDSLGQYDKAIDYYTQALAIAREIGDRKGEGDALAGLGSTYFSLGQYDKAIDYYDRALAVAREIENRQGEGDALAGLGIAYNSLGRYDAAIDYYTQALTISREIGNRQGEGNALGGLGMAYRSLGVDDEAKQFFEKSLFILEEIKDPSAHLVRKWIAELEAKGG